MTAYNPQANGLDERFNEMLPVIDDNASEWDRFLESVLFAYHTSKQASTKFSPFVLLYGRDPILPVELIAPIKVNKHSAH